MRLSGLVTVALPGAYGKPRPALVIQSDPFDQHSSVTMLPITSELRDSPLFQIAIAPSAENGLCRPSQVMVDKAHTVPREKLSHPIGRLEDDVLLGTARALAVFARIA